MEWIKLSIFTTGEGIDAVCDALYDIGMKDVQIEDEQEFTEFLEDNKKYWDYVDADLESRFSGLSRIKCYLADDEAGKDVLERIIAAYGNLQVDHVR